MTSNRSIRPEVGYRLAAYVDGEGCFVIRRQRSRNGQRLISYGCSFAVLVREDDAAILERFHDELGGDLGSFYYSGERAKTGRDNKPFVAWRVENQSGCSALVRIFDEYPLWSKKARDYAIWRQAVRYWCGPKPQGQAPLEAWFHEIRAIRTFIPGELAEVEELELTEPLFELETV